MRHNGCDVIVTYCWNRVGYNILRSLHLHGLNVWTADTSRRNICSMSKYCAGSFVYPDPFTEENEFIECLLKHVELLKPKMLLPTHDESVVIMRHRDRFPEDLIIPYENEELLLRLSNKATATELARECGIPVPDVHKSATDVKSYPAVIKPVIGNSAKSVYFPRNESELMHLLEKHKDEETLLEEWINGTDYSIDCVRWHSYFQASVYRALVTKTIGGGTSTQREIVEMPEIEAYAKRLLDAVDYNGVCGMDFRYDAESKRIAFIEVNARFTGGVATPIAAGFDIPWVLYVLATKGSFTDAIDIKVGTKTKWILGDIITLVSRAAALHFSASEMKRVLSICGFDAYDDFYSDDKCAILGEMWYYFSKLVKNGGKLNP